MNMEPCTASLHAGLIQRARPAKAVPLREDACSGRASVVQLRASDIARARPAPLGECELPGRAPARAVTPPLAHADNMVAGVAPSRRFGLTVRVGEGLRERLLEARKRTGRTAQSILHDALVSYLAAHERKPIER